MGLFLAMSGVVGADVEAWNQRSRGLLSRAEVRLVLHQEEAPRTQIRLCFSARILVVVCCIQENSWDEASEYLSRQLATPVLAFHIHDGDLWMFQMFDKGEVVTQFNPLPEYWDDNISEEERESWSGDATAIASRISGVAVENIQPYLCHWNLDNDDLGKAFPDDEFGYHDCWQLCDFMKRLGLEYPIDAAGRILGKAYEFIVPEGIQANSQ